MRVVPVALSFLSLTAPAIAGKVWVVGPAPGQLHDLQDTIILAQDGDVILVKQGTYEPIRTLGRTVSIVAEMQANVQLAGGVRVINFPAGSTAVFSGLTAAVQTGSALAELNTGLYVRNAAGNVIAQDSTFTTTMQAAGATVSECNNLTLVRCTVRALTPPNSLGASGIQIASGAKVSLEETWGAGSSGFNGVNTSATNVDGCTGGSGLAVIAPTNGAPTFVFASKCQFLGGNGGNSSYAWAGFTICGEPGHGGAGVFGLNPNGPVTLIDSFAIGGAGGTFASFCGGVTLPPSEAYWNGNGYNCGSAGAYVSAPTQYTLLSGSSRLLHGSRLVRDDTRATLSFVGAPTEFVELAVTLKPTGFVPQSANGGVLHVISNAWRRIGVVPAGGTLVHGFKLPNLPPSDPGATYFAQARFIDPTTGHVRLSNLHTIVEVDASY